MQRRVLALIALILSLTWLIPVYAIEKVAASTVTLTDCKRGPKLHLSFQKPEDWSIQWYNESDSTTSIARVFRDEANGREAIIIAATEISHEYADTPPEKIFSCEAFRKTAAAFNASINKPSGSVKWNGVYLDYTFPESATKGLYRCDVKNWMMISGDQIVQFQCYYIFDSDLNAEQQASARRALDLAYAKILNSVSDDKGDYSQETAPKR